MKVLATLLGLVVVALNLRLWLDDEGGVRELRRMEQALHRQEETNRGLRERNRILEAEVWDLQQGLDAIEERARTELGMVREGESFFRVVDPPALPRSPPGAR